jgi:hypothetical protein
LLIGTYSPLWTDSTGIATVAGFWGEPFRAAPDFPSPYRHVVRCLNQMGGDVLVDSSPPTGEFEFNIPLGATVDCTWIKLIAPPTLKLGISAVSGTVGSPLGLILTGFPPNQAIELRWDNKFQGYPFLTDQDGNCSVNIRVPATTQGLHTITARFGEDATASMQFKIVPLIKISPTTELRGRTVYVTLRGCAPRTIVRIRWKKGTTWVEVARVTTSGTGSASVGVTVPLWAPEGPNSIRGDALTIEGGRAQARTFMVDAGIHAAEATPAATSTLTETPEIQVTNEPSVEATATQSQTATPLPTETPSPTIAPTETPTNTPTPIPTETATTVPTSTPTAVEEVPTDQPAT